MDALKTTFLKISTVILLLTALSCSREDVENPVVPQILLDSELLVSKSRKQIADFILATGLPLPDSEIRSGVDIYRVTYKTHLYETSIVASGLVLLPQSTEPVGMLCFQHGTIISHKDAPSEAKSTDDILLFYASISTPGLIGVVPDFIGFGASKNILHPYYLERPTAEAIMDNLKAARELALTKGMNFNHRLFLAGYSEGGYATMATHKAIETSGLENFDLIASFPASGGYDIKGVQEFFFEQETYSQPFFIAFVALAYKTTLGWTEPLTDFFQEPYASKIPQLFNGQNSGNDINSSLTNSVDDLLSSDILANINSNAKYQYINVAFDENSLVDWVPKIKMFMYHGDLDITVPYQNSVEAHHQFIKNGASPDIVKFTTLPYANHYTGITPYLVALINQLLILK